MAVIPHNVNLIDYPDEFKKLIFTRTDKQNDHLKNLKIISFSQEIEPIDPLVFFSVMQEKNQVSFYWQNQRNQEAIVAIGAIRTLNINSDQVNGEYSQTERFQKCQNFLKNNLNNFQIFGNSLKYNENYFFSYFSFFPHNNKENSFPSGTIFLPYIQLIKKLDKYTLTINTYNDDIEKIQTSINHNFSQKIEKNYHKNHELNNENIYDIDEYQYENFIDKVNQGLDSIATRKLTKVVIAHALEIKIEDKFNIIKSLENLRKNHSDCYIFAVGNELEEYFIGASPERLLSIRQNQLVSDALAGSASRGKNEQEDQILGNQLLNGDKEKREHQFVSDFIYNQLLKMDLAPKKSPLQLLKLSNIQHLWTPIYAQIKNDIHPLEIISKLHPTPAVAGEPIEIACEEIEKSENFERSLYASPIGWVNMDGDCEFIVGIRSALIKQNIATLYAGAGIVAGSQPDKELIEIKLKFQALLQALI